MADDAPGYIYRHPMLAEGELRPLLAQLGRGWAWSPTQITPRAEDDALRDEGRTFGPALEVRWRRDRATFDVLVLALAPLTLPEGFAPLLPGEGQRWHVASYPYRLRRPAEAQSDERLPSTYFLAPDGSVQFVTLIGAESRKES